MNDIQDRIDEKTKIKLLDWHLTDTGNAEKIVEMFGDRLRFDHKRNRWLVWGEHRWISDDDSQVVRLALDTAKARYIEAAEIESLELRAKVSKWAITSESKQKVDSALGLAKSLLPISDKGNDWDRDNMLLSCPNGILDLTTGKLRRGKQEDRITMCANAEFEPEAKCPRWLKFLNEIFQGDKELIAYIKKALGYSITGLTTEQVAFFCFGTGSNGKSVLFKTIQDLMGDYAHNAPASLFQRVYSSNSNDVAATEFKRFLVSSETLSTSKINEQRLKAWTGGDKVSARYLYSEYFTFDPTCKPWLFVNHKPQVEDDSHGFWRRVRLIPFGKVFKPSEQDHTLINKLKDEQSGILNWLLEGCLLWQKEGLNPTPELVTQATDLYQQENDLIAEFLADECVQADDAQVKSMEIYKTYNLWSERMGLKKEDVLSNTAFGRRMGDKFKKQRMSKGNIYLGVAVSSNYQPTLIQESKPEQPVQKTPEQLSQECVFCGIWLSAEAMEAHLKNLHSEEVKTNK